MRYEYEKLDSIYFSVSCILGLVGCNNRTMDYIIENEPSIIGIVEEVHDNLITVYINTEDYPNEENC